MEFFGKKQQAVRTKKLHNIFILLQSFLKEKIELVKPSIAQKLSVVLDLPLPQDIYSPEFLLCLIVESRKKQTVQAQKLLLETKADFNIRVRAVINSDPEARLVDEELGLFIEDHPLLSVISDSIQETNDIIKVLRSGTKEQIISAITDKDLVGSFISMEIFSMRSSKSRVLTQSLLVKDTMNEWNKFLNENISQNFTVNLSNFDSGYTLYADPNSVNFGKIVYH
jgi:hypothetical protein